jgi:flagella basal body P-ring formation protein FlgA
MRTTLAVMVILAMNGVGLAQVIRLKPLATVELRQDVRVGDVASVSGAGADAVANTVLVAGIEKPMQVKAEAVLMALMTQRGTSGAGNLQMGGAAVCEIAVKGGESALKGGENGGAGANASVKIAGIGAGGGKDGDRTGAAKGERNANAEGVKGERGVSEGAVAEGATLRNVIVSKLVQDTGVGLEDLRVEFNTTSPLVDSAAGSGQRWLVRPLTRTLLGAVQFEAQLAEGTKVLQRLNVLTEVRRRQRVVVTAAALKRGMMVGAEMVRQEDVWIDRVVPTVFGSVTDVVGLEAQRDVDAGSAADQRDFKPLLMAHKGDVVTVVYVAGPLEVQIKGRALMDGKFHEVIEVRNDSTGEKIGAVMVKKGLGVAGSVTEEQERRLTGG